MRDPNIFGDCLVDSDPASNRRTRGRLRKALFIALTLEALALAILLLAPLAKTSVLPPMRLIDFGFDRFAERSLFTPTLLAPILNDTHRTWHNCLDRGVFINRTKFHTA